MSAKPLGTRAELAGMLALIVETLARQQIRIAECSELTSIEKEVRQHIAESAVALKALASDIVRAARAEKPARRRLLKKKVTPQEAEVYKSRF